MLLNIWKYPIPVQDEIQIEMPKGARVLTVQMQDEQPCVWALGNPVAEKEIRQFHMAGTGHPIEHAEKLTYIGTFQMKNGTLVLHLFEKMRA